MLSKKQVRLMDSSIWQKGRKKKVGLRNDNGGAEKNDGERVGWESAKADDGGGR